MRTIEYKVIWREFTGYKDSESKEILFQWPYSRNPEGDAFDLAEALRNDPGQVGLEIGDVKIQRRVVSPWMECIGV